MIKEMGGSDWDPWQSLNKKSNHLLLKLFVSVLIMGFSFRLIFSRSSPFFPFSQSPSVATIFESQQDIPSMEKSNVSDTVIPQTPDIDIQDSNKVITSVEKSNVSDTVIPPIPNVDKQDSNNDSQREEELNFSETTIPQIPIDIDGQDSKQENCDLFSGMWVRSSSGPSYTNTSCPFIENQQNCMKNGRPDTDYLYWRWKPHGCDVTPFDAEKFLEAMRDKSWAFIGDSILRNHGQSLVCLLSKAELAVQVYHDEDYKSRSWRFPSYNFTVSIVWSPFLVKADIFENDEGVSKSEIQLHLNTLSTNWTQNYHTYNYILISVGQWFLKTAVYWEDEKIVGCHYCPQLNFTEVGLDYAYRRVLESVFRFVAKSSHKPMVFYRTWTPDHFAYGEWSSGGICNRTLPYKEGEYNGKDVDHLMYQIELEEFQKINGTNLKLLDTYHLSLLRPDGHPGPYRNFRPFDTDNNVNVQNDCLHWCLPGPIDSWNELLMKMVLKD